jgi:hypothetical protein
MTEPRISQESPAVEGLPDIAELNAAYGEAIQIQEIAIRAVANAQVALDEARDAVEQATQTRMRAHQNIDAYWRRAARGGK